MSMSSMPNRLHHEWVGLKYDLAKAIKRRTIFLRCDEDCNCGREYNALRYLWVIPYHIIAFRLNPVNWLDKWLCEEHHRCFQQVPWQLQQPYESFLWDRQFRHAGICEDCGRGKYSYGLDTATCNYCGIIILSRYRA